MSFDIDDILIAVFLTLSLILIVAWYVAILKWKKRHLAKILPCVKYANLLTTTFQKHLKNVNLFLLNRIKTREKIPKAPHELNDFKYPSINVISKPNYHENPQFVDIAIDEMQPGTSNDSNAAIKSDQAKYAYKIDSSNNMVIDANQLQPDLDRSILMNLNKNQGIEEHINHVKVFKEESYRRYNDMIKSQVEGASEVSRF